MEIGLEQLFTLEARTFRTANVRLFFSHSTLFTRKKKKKKSSTACTTVPKNDGHNLTAVIMATKTAPQRR